MKSEKQYILQDEVHNYDHYRPIQMPFMEAPASDPANM